MLSYDHFQNSCDDNNDDSRLEADPWADDVCDNDNDDDDDDDDDHELLEILGVRQN